MPRLHNLNFKLTYADMVQDIKPDIVAGTAACEEVRNSQKFSKILELILLLGNYMNSGSKNEAAFGFEISYLTKLTNTKDSDNKQTLLHYLADLVEKRFPDALNFYDDLSHVDKASRVNMDGIQKSMRLMNSAVMNLETDLQNNKVPQCDDDKFSEVMSKFAAECRQQVDVLGEFRHNCNQNSHHNMVIVSLKAKCNYKWRNCSRTSASTMPSITTSTPWKSSLRT